MRLSAFTSSKVLHSTKMQLSVKRYVPLLWGVCVWFAVASMTTSTPENRSTNVTAEANYATERPTPAEDLQTARWDLMLTSKGVSAATEKTASQIQTTEKSDGIVVTTAAAATNSSKVPAPMEEVITRGVAKVSTLGTAITSEAQLSPAAATTRGKVQPSSAVTTATTEVQPSPAVTTATTEVQPSPEVTMATTKVQPSPAVTTTTDEARSPHNTTNTLNHTSGQPHQSSASIFTENATPTTVYSQQPTSITGVTSEIPSTTSLKTSTQNVSHVIRDISSPTPSSEEAGVKLSSTSQSVPKSSTFKSATSEKEETTDSPSATTFNSKPKRLPIPTTKPAPAATTTPCETSKQSPSSELQPCSTRGTAKQCLIIIAVLAALATVFMVSTIVLCVKLSARRPKVKKPQATEMMCISALLPERTPTYTRHRNPVSNGVLVLPGFADSDEEGGDNVTLSSFLPDNDRYL